MKNTSISITVLTALLVSWAVAEKKEDSSIGGSSEPRAAHYAPGLGEIMTLTQIHHSKLWFAGKAENWKLAEYEVKELQEGFDNAVKFHPERSKLLADMMKGSMASLQKSIVNKDDVEFEKAYGALTTSCNACHDATDFGFNKVIVPMNNPFPNQDFKAR